MRHVNRGLTSWSLALSAVAMLAACASIGSTVRTHETPRSDGAYVYGRFSLATKGLMLLQPGAVGDANLVVKCDSGEELSIAFLEDNAAQLLQLKPSRCALAEMVFKNAIGVTLDSRATPMADVKFDLAPGTAYYIGDWELNVDRERKGGKIRSSMKWKMADRYGTTTEIVKTAYPLFRAFPAAHLFRPRATEDFVNCVSKGERTWTYRSQCD